MIERGRPLYEQLQEELRQLIRRENPMMLPSERELMEQYKVSRKTVRRAIQQLAEEGMLTQVHGKGTLVTPGNKDHGRVLILIDHFHQMPLYEYEIYLAVRSSLREHDIPATVLMVDPDSPEPPSAPDSQWKGKTLLFSAICNRKDSQDQLRRHFGDLLVVGYKPAIPGYTAIYSDIRDGISKITRHLIASGHRRIAYAGLARDAERHDAYRSELAAAGIPYDPSICFETIGTRHSGYQTGMSILGHATDFSAILAHNDLSALGMMEAAMRMNIRIPADLSLAGCDNIGDAANFPQPLTTCAHDHELYRRLTLEFLSGAQLPESTRLPMRTIIRNSVKNLE